MSSPLFPLREDQSAAPRRSVKTGANLQPPASGDQPPSAGAWKREMERAQLDSWFKPRQAVSGAEGRTAGAGSQTNLNPGTPHLAPPKNGVKADARMPAPALAAGPARNHVPVMQASIPSAAHPPKFEAGRIGAADVRLGGLAVALAGVLRVKVAELTPASAHSAAVLADVPNASDGLHALNTRSEESSPDEQAIRLHAEWHGQDVTVWLGLDARTGTPQEQLAQLLPHIRACLQEQRSRLVKLVCNGKTVFEVSSPFLSAFPYFTQPKESP